MSQTTQSSSVNNANNHATSTSTPAPTSINYTQVAPQEPISPNPPDYSGQQKQMVNRALSTNRTSHDTMSRTPHTVFGPKHGFLSLLFCCASDTSAWMDPSIAKTSSPISTSSMGAQIDTTAGRPKRKKKHWYNRWYHPKLVETQEPIAPNSIHMNGSNPITTAAASATITASSTTPPATPTTPTIPPLPQQDKMTKTSNTSPTPTTTHPPMALPLTDVHTNQMYSTEMAEMSPITWLLPPISPEHTGRKCLVLDLDETLVHSSFKIIPNPDFVVPVEIDQQVHNVYVLKRPGVDEFMRRMGEKYEIVVFTASLSKYADPVLDILDKHKVVKHRLFRESCFNHKGSYVKDLSQLGRDLANTLILDNSPTSYLFHTSNAVPVSTWFNDPHDTELTDLIDFLNDLTFVDDVTLILDSAIEPISKMK